MLHEFAARGSIARTAEALGYTPSAVSQQLAVLEKEAGTPLLDRTARSAGPDRRGQAPGRPRRAHPRHGRGRRGRPVRAGRPAERPRRGDRVPVRRGRVRPGAGPFAREHPQLSLLLREADPAEGLQLVRSGEVEVAIVDDWTGRHVGRPGGRATPGHGVLSYYHLVRDPLILVVGRDHPAADPDRPVDLRALRNESVARRPVGEPSQAGGGPAARRRRADPAGPVGVRGPRHGRQPGRPRPRHRDHAAARRRRLRAAGRGPRAAGRPRPGQGRVRGGAHRVAWSARRSR